MKLSNIFKFFLMFMCLTPTIVYGVELFTDNFNNHSPWQPRPGTGDTSPSGASATCDTGDCTGLVPNGWSYFRTTGLWWGPEYQDTIRISSEQDRGTGGKAYIQWNESNVGASGDGWGADGILAKYFDQNYKELYIQFYIKLSPTWQWPSDANGQVKIFRVAHWDSSLGGTFFNFPTGSNGPMYIFDLYKSLNWGWRQFHAMRCYPQSSYYYCPEGDLNPTFDGNFADPGELGDGEWHRLDFHLKMNTKVGNIWQSDGVLEFSYDGATMLSITDKKWIYEGDDTTLGWNLVGIGGNAYNTYDTASEHSEQWYAIDDITISGTPFVDSTSTIYDKYDAVEIRIR